MIKIEEKYFNLSDILKAKDKLIGVNLEQNLKFSKEQIEADLDLLEREFAKHSRKHGKIPNAQLIANFIALIFYKDGRKLTVGVDGVEGEPSTDFSRAVKRAFEKLLDKNLDTSMALPDWRRYAQKAKDSLLRTSAD